MLPKVEQSLKKFSYWNYEIRRRS